MSLPARYYDFHDAEYARRLKNGRVGWDEGEYDQFFMRPFIERSLQQARFQQRGLRALDLGCGRGALLSSGGKGF